ncbi:hypothetical protein GIB67_033335 [Kingdonia uniflora]|uniref:WRKY domain-containing protein n=1 Tax=Kingdonia uniflora TaxID=39325 RepID=A0A7J7LTH5_9MAGN|nr:hypothetical protein GIB67_033335 [Kingdonia uniflora]
MVGIDDHVAVMGDWVPPNPSPRTLFSSILGDDFTPRSFSELLGDNGSEGPFEKQMNCQEEDAEEVRDSGNGLSETPVFSSQKTITRGSLAERMAARAGFNAPTLNTENIRSANISSSSDVRSPYLTIPPGLSPTTLLDSPVFLSNSLAQPSPTTGKFFAQCSKIKSSTLVPETSNGVDDNLFENSDATFAFKPHLGTSSSFLHIASNKDTSVSHPRQSFPSIEVSIRSLEATDVHSQDNNGFHFGAAFPNSTNCNNTTFEPRASDPVNPSTECSPPFDSPLHGEGDQQSPGEFNSTVVGSTSSEDGYNWRKYGQKQVKGSECPRSYYKCTHPNCQVKKKVERSHEGHITEIIYKGNHNHPRPPPNRRSSNQQNDMPFDILEPAGAQAGIESECLWVNSKRGDASGGPDWRHDNLEATSPATVDPRFCDSSLTQAQKGSHFEAAITVDASPTISNDEDEDDRGTHGSASLGYDGEGDESESKRRKIDAIEMSGASRAIREPRVVVQTTSEVDILDDGYRWRKYGQKVVKGNPNPRSYYKCTNTGCTVRKHVERASHDLKSVITTYEGKHNHDVPAARNNSHASSGPSISGAQSRIHRPEPSHMHNNPNRFDGPTSLASFGLPGTGRQQMGQSPGFSFGMGQPGLANLAMAGLGPGQGKLPIHSYLGQQHQMNQMGYLMPKGEPKNEPISETSLNLSKSSSVYHQIMSRMPQM